MATEELLFTSAEEQKLKEQKIEMKIENEKYLRRHPEISELLEEVVRQVMLDRPQNPVKFVEQFIIESDLSKVVEEARDRKKQSP